MESQLQIKSVMIPPTGQVTIMVLEHQYIEACMREKAFDGLGSKVFGGLQSRIPDVC